jgi:Cysteine-rich secretory protein family
MLLGLVVDIANFVFFTPPTITYAKGESAYDLINTINALRANLNLGPSQVDSWLMGYAQEHAEYLASIHRGTHEHRDGSHPMDEIRRQNGMAANSTFIYSDQRLFIRYASPITPTPPGTSSKLSPQIIISPGPISTAVLT